MSVAYATKDQMKVWKATTKPDKDYDARPSDNVMLTVKDTDDGSVAYLVASDGYQLIKRNLQPEADAKTEAPLKVAIPREAIEKAEKVMKSHDRAYFEANKIVVMEVTEDEDTLQDITRVIANIPYAEQLDLFRDFESVLEKAVNATDKPEKVCVIDARILRKLTDQLKSGDENVYLSIHFKGELDPVVMSAFEDMDYMELTAAIMPIKR